MEAEAEQALVAEAVQAQEQEVVQARAQEVAAEMEVELEVVPVILWATEKP